MLSVARAVRSSAKESEELPYVPELQNLYEKGCKIRRGELVMIAGRSGVQKSGFALWYALQLANKGLHVAYFSGDMNAYQASSRIACSEMDKTTEEVSELWRTAPDEIERSLAGISIDFKFGPITWRNIDNHLRAHVAIWNGFPDVVIVDNLMDVEDSSAEYQAQMDTMASLSELAHTLGVTVIVMHHASDKGSGAAIDPYSPPARWEIKGGMAEKPELVLSVALHPDTGQYKIAVVKSRMSQCDPAASKVVARLTCDPARTRFMRYVPGRGLE